MGRRVEGIGLAVGLAFALAGAALAARPQAPVKSAAVRVYVQTIPLSPRTGSPRGFYVTVNTRAYPNGALRGRLAAWEKVSSDSDAAVECAFS